MPKADRSPVPDTAAVRAAMGQERRHAREHGRVDQTAVPLEPAGYAAHRAVPLLGVWEIGGRRKS
jgi:hypothetical protein